MEEPIILAEHLSKDFILFRRTHGFKGMLLHLPKYIQDRTKPHKRRVLNALGFGGLENARGLGQLHADKAAEENLRLASEYVAADVFDDHAVHTEEHTRFLLSGEFKKCGEGAKERFLRHIAEHAAMSEKEKKTAETGMTD